MSDDTPDESDEEPLDRPTSFDVADVTAMAPSSTYKVLGQMATGDGTGILGHNTATSGTAHGVEGVTDSADAGAAGVYGEAAAGSGGTYGVEGTTRAPGGWLARAAGVKGNATNSTSLNSAAYGVLGRSDGRGYLHPTFGFPVYSSGVKGEASATSGTYTAGVYGTNNGAHAGAAGVRGEATQGSGRTYGVYGVTRSNEVGAAGVVGRSENGADAMLADATSGGDTGIVARASGGFDYAVDAENLDPSSSYAHAIRANNESPDAAAVDASGGLKSSAFSGTALEVLGEPLGSNSDPGGYPARIHAFQNGTANTRVLALSTGHSGNPTADTNFVGFFDADDAAYGSIQGDGSGGVTLNSGSADYAEYLPRKDPDEAIDAADVVAVVGGAVTKRTADADQAFVVSDRPIVTGNSPGQDPDDRAGYEVVAFVGQVPVKVRGQVDAGDLVVPSGEDDGTGEAIPADGWTPGDGPVVGRAWEASDDEGVSAVTVAVGLETGEALEPAVAGHRERIDELEAVNEELRRENDALRERLAAVETHVGLDGPDQPTVADD